MHALRKSLPRPIRKTPNAEPILFDHSFIPFMIVIISPIVTSPEAVGSPSHCKNTNALDRTCVMLISQRPR